MTTTTTQSRRGRFTPSSKKWKVPAALGAASLLLAACGGNGGTTNGEGTATNDEEPIELVVATITEPGVPSAAVMHWFLDEVTERSEGRLKFDVPPANAVCPGAEIAPCTEDGRADVGVTIPDYTPQMFPQITVVSVPFVAADQQAQMQALYTVNHEHPGAMKLWEDNNLVMIAHWSAGRLTLGSPEPVNSIADMQNTRWRVSGPYLQRAVEAIGGSNIAVPAPETYEAIERGVADAVGFAVDGAVDYKLMELLPYWTDPGTGHYNTFGMWFNKDVYDGLPDDLRAIVDEVTTELNGGKGIEAFAKVAATQCDALEAEPNVKDFTQWDASATEEWQSKVGDSLLEQWVQDAEKNGLEDAQGYLDTYRNLIDNYDGPAVPDPIDECVAQFAANK